MIESHDYQVRLTGTHAKGGYLESDEAGLLRLEVASPPEFGGPEGTWSPEHLFVSAISACLMTTFHAIAEIADLEIVEYRDDASGHLQRGSDRLYRMDMVTLRPRVVIADESKIEKALRLLARAEEVCLISRSVSSVIDMHPTVIAPGRVDAIA